MNERNIFSVGLRLLGLYAAARGFDDLLYCLLFALGVHDSDPSVLKQYPSQTLVLGVVFFAIGLYLVKGGGLIVDYAMGRTVDDEVTDEEAS